MTGRTHDFAAVTALGVVVLNRPPLVINLGTAVLSILACLIGGIAPDIDQPTAPFWRNLPVIKYFGKLLSLTVDGHRFLTHSLLVLGIVGFLLHYGLVFLTPILGNADTEYI